MFVAGKPGKARTTACLTFETALGNWIERNMTQEDPTVVLGRILSEIEVPEESDYIKELTYVPEIAERLPLSYMVFLAVLLGSDCKYEFQPSEKTTWSITLRFRGIVVRLEYGKFGMRLATDAPQDAALIDALIALLNQAFPLADRALRPLVGKQIGLGHVTVHNMFPLLDGKYRFFRGKAQEAYELPPPPLNLTVRDGKLSASPRVWDPTKPRREGFYFGSATIDAYFSRLEHQFVLILPFVDFDPTRENLLAFIGSNWSDMMKRVCDLASDRDAKQLYDDLLGIKERYRNPLSHGGVEKGGASLLVHIPGAGAVPVMLSRFEDSIEWRFL